MVYGLGVRVRVQGLGFVFHGSCSWLMVHVCWFMVYDSWFGIRG
jgi:hypothetical protein